MSKYSDRISQSKEQKSAAEVASAENTAKLTVQKAITDVQLEQAKNAEAYEYALGTNPFDVSLVLKAQAEKDKLNEKLVALNTILTEQF